MNIGKILWRNRFSGQATTNPLIRALVILRDKNRCAVCGKIYTRNRLMAQLEPDRYFTDLEIDHIIPFSRGGRNALENYRPLCKRCNRQKGNKVEEVN